MVWFGLNEIFSLFKTTMSRKFPPFREKIKKKRKRKNTQINIDKPNYKAVALFHLLHGSVLWQYPPNYNLTLPQPYLVFIINPISLLPEQFQLYSRYCQ